MQNQLKGKRIIRTAGMTLVLCLAALVALVGNAGASSHPLPFAQATAVPVMTDSAGAQTCVDCHLDKKDAWQGSSHAHAAESSAFLEGWNSAGRATQCFLCHRASFQVDTAELTSEGVGCESCHGVADGSHPPAAIPARSDEQSCGTCHPSTLGETHLSGHTEANQVRCVDCHDPHSQSLLAPNPDDLCTKCHQEDVSAMDEALGKVHQQKDISCVTCHTINVPHAFLVNSQPGNMASFMQGADCASQISANVAHRTVSGFEAAGEMASSRRNWPTIHSVSRVESLPDCSNCHRVDDALRADFAALGFGEEELDNLSWDASDYPAIKRSDLTNLVAKPKRGWAWLVWTAGVVIIFGVFEVLVARKMDHLPNLFTKWKLTSLSRKKKSAQNPHSEEK